LSSPGADGLVPHLDPCRDSTTIDDLAWIALQNLPIRTRFLHRDARPSNYLVPLWGGLYARRCALDSNRWA